jgi:hypothetical protein
LRDSDGEPNIMSTTVVEKKRPASEGQGPKYELDIEGIIRDWSKDTVTTEEIIDLGGWDSSQGAIEIDKDNVEHTLVPGQVINLKPGHGFSKKVKWKRG